MININARRWVVALRSGRYKQGRGNLTTIDGSEVRHCCLGVACMLYQEWVRQDRFKITFDGRELAYNGEENYLPEEVQEWLGLRDNRGTYWAGSNVPSRFTLAGRNDDGASFEEIAAIIESEPAGLFGDPQPVDFHSVEEY